MACYRIAFISISIDNDDINKLSVPSLPSPRSTTADISPPNPSSQANNDYANPSKHHCHPSQEIHDGFDSNADSDNTSVDSTRSAGNSLKKNTLPSSDSAPDFCSSPHRRRSSKLGLDDLKCGERKNHNLVRIEVPLGKPIEEVYQGVHDGDVLGSGVSGIVRRVTHRATQVQYAVKCLDLALVDSDAGLRQLKEEIYIMCQLVSYVLQGARVERFVCVYTFRLLC